MTFMIECRVPVYSVKEGDQIVWRKVRALIEGGRPLSWTTRREAESFADLFIVKNHKSDVRVVEVCDG